MNRAFGRAIVLFLLVPLSSCGYHVLSARESLDFERLHVAPVANRTREPGLEDLLHRALVQELARDRRVRLVERDLAEVILETSVVRFDLFPTVEAAGLAVEYEVEMDADFKLLRPETGEVLLDIGGLGAPIRASFPAGDGALETRGAQEKAELEAAAAVARELARRLLLQ